MRTVFNSIMRAISLDHLPQPPVVVPARHTWVNSDRTDPMLPSAWLQKCKACGTDEDSNAAVMPCPGNLTLPPPEVEPCRHEWVDFHCLPVDPAMECGVEVCAICLEQNNFYRERRIDPIADAACVHGVDGCHCRWS